MKYENNEVCVMKEQSEIFRFLIRAVTGMVLIYLINQYILPETSSLKVGVNLITFFASGLLGVPGVGLLYGILLFQIL